VAKNNPPNETFILRKASCLQMGIKNQKILTLAFALLLISWAGNSQKLIRGLVVDSLTLDNVPGVNVKVKKSDRGTVSDINGIFVIMVYPGDTLIFSSVGYTKSEMLAQPEDEIMFVRLHEESIMLNEVVIRDRSYQYIKKVIYSPTLTKTKPLKPGRATAPPSGGAAAAVNFAYFTKQEKEKRKLVAVLQELERVKVYESIVNDPDFKYDIMEKYSLTESKYFELLAIFNQTQSSIIHSGDEVGILYSLHYYFNVSRGSKK
jgi:CarboxypepD_reg-like domain